MPIDPKDVEIVRDILVPGENVTFSATQRRVGPGGSITTPTTVICTNKRIIILNRATLGIRKDYESIYYKQITSVRLENGIINGSVFIRVQGYDKDKGLLKNGREEGEIDGLKREEAQELADFLNRKLTEINSEEYEEPRAPEQEESEAGEYIYCSKCGARNDASAKFCSSCGAPLSARNGA
ncbi:MAG: PH domain-containing protein [Candidatus Micrarchaeia archaeon]